MQPPEQFSAVRCQLCHSQLQLLRQPMTLANITKKGPTYSQMKCKHASMLATKYIPQQKEGLALSWLLGHRGLEFQQHASVRTGRRPLWRLQQLAGFRLLGLVGTAQRWLPGGVLPDQLRHQRCVPRCAPCLATQTGHPWAVNGPGPRGWGWCEVRLSGGVGRCSGQWDSSLAIQRSRVSGSDCAWTWVEICVLWRFVLMVAGRFPSQGLHAWC